MDSTVTIAITKLNNQTLKTSQASLVKLSYSVTKSSNTMKYDMTRPEYLIIKVDDIKKSLVILADPLESKPPGPTDHGVYNILNAPYKADPKGESYSHKQIQAAIDDASSHGGYVVYIPAGIYKCGSIVLKDNVELYLAGGSVLRYTGDPTMYEKWSEKNGRCVTYFIHTVQDG